MQECKGRHLTRQRGIVQEEQQPLYQGACRKARGFDPSVHQENVCGENLRGAVRVLRRVSSPD
jgi:hypothetical protein